MVTDLLDTMMITMIMVINIQDHDHQLSALACARLGATGQLGAAGIAAPSPLLLREGGGRDHEMLIACWVTMILREGDGHGHEIITAGYLRVFHQKAAPSVDLRAATCSSIICHRF